MSRVSRPFGPVAVTGWLRWFTTALWLSSACTPLRLPAQKSVEVQVEADPEVQAELDDVAVVVETRADGGGGWDPLATRRFTPQTASDWPLAWRLGQQDARSVYQVTATARDRRQAILAQARLIADPGERSTDRLRVRIDRECLRRTQLCGASTTCALGDCVDARLPLPQRTAAEADAGDAAAEGGGLVGSAPALAQLGAACAGEPARACEGHGSRTPLSCADGHWQAGETCAASERCDSAPGASQGKCAPIAEACRNREPGASFCAADGGMLVCPDLVSVEPRPCGDNEQCVDLAGDVRCACKPGFVDSGAGCREATVCGDDNGGCDPATKCEMRAGKPVCSACPEGYDGDGLTGCAPRLTGLTSSSGALQPAFAPEQRQYTLPVPLRTQRVELRASAPAGARVTIEQEELAAGEAWRSPVLALGETVIEIAVLSRYGARSRYALRVQRAGSEQAYLKPAAGSSGDYFGTALAAHGGMLLVGAPYEDSCATGVDGDAADDGCANSGAAYLFERSSGRFQQRAYLKPGERRAGQLFGASVALGDGLIVVGAIGDDIFQNALPSHSGAAYSFVRGADGWQADHTITPSDSSAGDGFGLALALAGDRLVVGAPLTDVGGQSSGSVYVFERASGKWLEKQTLRADDPAAEARFGSSLALDGETLIAGAPQDPRPAARSGAVYVFERTGGAYRMLQRLTAPAPRANQQLGFALAAQGGVLVVGAPHNGIDLTAQPHSGSVLVYARQGASWARGDSLEAPRPRASDFFGTSVALAPDALLVGASGDQSSGRGLAADPGQDGCEFCGAAYLYARQQADFALGAYIKSSNLGTRDGFGTAVALPDGAAVVSANLEDAAGRGDGSDPADDSQPDTGAVYVYE